MSVINSVSSLTPFFLNLQTVKYVKVACFALLIYDTIIALDQEYQHIWKKHWNLVKILYLYSRYCTFIDTGIAIYGKIS
ncbi:hypothetical protein D9758_016380 [Tetrapyrgos nigripes]|uniref:DUF6533 domain-containing protein n=1 Tax=Tetrapyrgos nigripes TaxID=182062 RepID=A0A8H5FHH1_9AGAR|nr:hypothetical protein D9758_016380 [Tetrapyrgos nigripes]